MKRLCFGWVVVFALFAIQGCRAPSPDWNGTWKLTPTKSSYQGQVLTISISADGEYRFDEKSSHTLRCNGKDLPIGNNRALLCVKSGDPHHLPYPAKRGRVLYFYIIEMGRHAHY
jgi:hypothetical protein